MKNKKKIIIPAFLLAFIMGAGAYGIANANTKEGPFHSALVEKIAQRFNLNKDDVEKVFDENRDEVQKNMQANFEKRLDDAVSRGEITKEQKEAIIKKRAELQAQFEGNRDKIRDMTPAERKAQFENHRAEIEKWAKDNGIDLKYLIGGIGRGMARGFHGFNK